MTSGRPKNGIAAAAILVALGLAGSAVGLRGSASGHAAGLAPAARAGCPPPPPSRKRKKELLITSPRWLEATIVTEYWPAPERWFVGRLVAAPGIPGRHRVDWLYSGRGLPMEGDGVGLDGRRYHFAGPYGLSWVNGAGEPTTPCADGSWSTGRPFWTAFGWRNAQGEVTFPLPAGGWSNGAPAKVIPPPGGLHFALGPSLPLSYWHSIAVDPKLIPFGSRIFVPAYCDKPNKGWFVAADTGGAIIGHHVDVYRPAPASPDDGQLLRGQRIFVVPPGSNAIPKRAGLHAALSCRGGS